MGVVVVAGAEVVVKVEDVLEMVDEELVDVGLIGQVGSIMVAETC